MHSTTHRRLCGVLGGGLIVLVGAGVALLGLDVFALPTVLQAGLLGVAGVLDLIAAFENPVTDRIDWYQMNGAANVALGLALPVGLLGWGPGTGSTEALFLAVSTVGGLALAAMGVDICLYAGEHLYRRPLDAEPE